MNSWSLLDFWTREKWSSGLQIRQTAILDRVFVWTSNSLYELIIISPSTNEVMIRGGKYFPNYACVRLSGSSMGGSFLKLGGIYVGFRMEIAEHGNTIVTGPVGKIAVYA
jgi:hypothetical protein